MDRYIPLSMTLSNDSSGKKLISLTSICISIEIHEGNLPKNFCAYFRTSNIRLFIEIKEVDLPKDTFQLRDVLIFSSHHFYGH